MENQKVLLNSKGTSTGQTLIICIGKKHEKMHICFLCILNQAPLHLNQFQLHPNMKYKWNCQKKKNMSKAFDCVDHD